MYTVYFSPGHTVCKSKSVLHVECQNVQKALESDNVDCLVLRSNLDETAKNVFKENIRVTEALASHIDEADELRDHVRRLEYENRQLHNDQEMSEMLVQQKVAQSKRNKQTIKEVTHVLCYTL